MYLVLLYQQIYWKLYSHVALECVYNLINLV